MDATITYFFYLVAMLLCPRRETGLELVVVVTHTHVFKIRIVDIIRI